MQSPCFAGDCSKASMRSPIGLECFPELSSYPYSRLSKHGLLSVFN